MQYKERDESFQRESYRVNRGLRYALVFLTVYLIAISLLPLLYNLLNEFGFEIIGLTPYTNSFRTTPGSYVFSSDEYEVLLSSPAVESNKPKIATFDNSLPAVLIDLVELSDVESTINSVPISQSQQITQLIDEETLVQKYIFDDFTIEKTIEVTESDIIVTYSSTRLVDFKLSLWRWYYEKINNEDVSSFDDSEKIILNNQNRIDFTFNEGAIGEGNILISKPSSLTIEKDSLGMNKILLETRTNNLILKISGEVENVQASPITILIARALNNIIAAIVFPIVTTLVLILAWKKWSK